MLNNKFVYNSKVNNPVYHVIDTGGKKTYCGLEKEKIPNRRYTTKNPTSSRVKKPRFCEPCQQENLQRHKQSTAWAGWA